MTYGMQRILSIFAKCGDSWYGRNKDRTSSTLNSFILFTFHKVKNVKSRMYGSLPKSPNQPFQNLPHHPFQNPSPHNVKKMARFESSTSFCSLVNKVLSRSIMISLNKGSSYFNTRGWMDESWMKAFLARAWMEWRSWTNAWEEGNR